MSADALPTPALLPCPFCGKAMQFRKALWPSDGCTDAVIHADPSECGLMNFSTGTIDESVIAAWNRRAAPCAAMGEVKGEAVAHAVIRSNGPDASPRLIADPAFERRLREAPDVSVPLFAAPVGKARMLTEEEIYGALIYSSTDQLARRLQEIFCEVNGITLSGGNRSRG